MKILLATNNEHKIGEIRQILGDPFQLIAPSELKIILEVDENGDTFEKNAFLKASAFSEESALPCLADDSGLCVDCLDGDPGIFSARYAGEQAADVDNNDKLLREMRGATDRRAKFVCCMVLVQGKRTLLKATGECYGNIIQAPAGESGFGYDPLFVPDGETLSFAQLGEDKKNSLSHRRKALEQIKQQLGSMM